jgi:hypothetical protein
MQLFARPYTPERRNMQVKAHQRYTVTLEEKAHMCIRLNYLKTEFLLNNI